jgi:hypothetical protein
MSLESDSAPPADPEVAPAPAGEPVEEEEATSRGRTSSRATVAWQMERLVSAIRNGNEEMVESSIPALSQRSRWLAPLALVVGAFAMLFQGFKLLVTNWRLTLVQILPAMWI